MTAHELAEAREIAKKMFANGTLTVRPAVKEAQVNFTARTVRPSVSRASKQPAGSIVVKPLKESENGPSLVQLVCMEKQFKLIMSEAKALLSELGSAIEQADPVSGQSIIRRVSKCTGIRESEIKGKSRVFNIAWARHVAMYLIRRTGKTLEETAVYFNGFDHSTISHGEHRVQNLIELKDEPTIKLIAEIPIV